MEIHFTRTKDKKEIDFRGRLEELLKKEGINPATIIVVRENTVLTLDSKLSNNDRLIVLPVISGG
jgi:sulfur carrier protein ThiS